MNTSLKTNPNAFAAIKDDGTVEAWGKSDHVITTVPNILTNTNLENFSKVKSIYSGGNAFAALKADGSVVAWGAADWGGNAPSDLSDVNNIYSTNAAFAALKADGSVVAWGAADWGGNAPSDLSDVNNIYSTNAAFAALKQDGTVTAWGGSDYGGGGVPTDLTDGTKTVTAIYSTGSAFAALTSEGTVTAWGSSSYGGDASAVQDQLTGVTAIYSIDAAFAALKTDGSVVSWGKDGGWGSNFISTPTTLTNVVTISYGNHYYQGQYYSSTVPVYVYVYVPPSQPPAAPICFPKGTPVATDQGSVAIENLNTDKHTIRGKEIVAITQSRPIQKSIVCFEKDSLNKNVPSQQTLCSMEHKVFYKGEMMKARDIVDVCENVTFVPYNGETLFNVLLKKEDKMMINNLICETLHPKNIMAKISQMKNEKKKNRAIQELTKIIKENNIPEYQKLYASL